MKAEPMKDLRWSVLLATCFNRTRPSTWIANGQEALDYFWHQSFSRCRLFAHGVEKRFSSLSKKQRTDLVIRLIGIIKRRMTIGIAISMSDTDFGQIPGPNWVRGGPYGFCALHALAAVVAWAEKRSYSGKITYFFESGHRHEGHTNEVFQELRRHPSGAAGLRYHSHAFAGKRDVRPLQAADLLAYEWHKELKRRNGPPTHRSMRRSLMSLLDQTHIAKHFQAKHVARFFRGGYSAILDHVQEFDVIE